MATLSTIPYDLPLRHPYVWARGKQDRRQGVLVRIEAEGQTGWGEVAPPPDARVDAPALQSQIQSIAKELDWNDPDCLSHWHSSPLDARIRCGISTALLDARAQAQGICIAALLAGPDRQVPDAVPVNALIGAVEPHAAGKAATTAVNAGFTTLKIKLDRDQPANMARVAAVRAAAPDACLRGDANGSWGKEAATNLAELARFDLDYVEQPVAPDDEAGLAELTGGPVPIALDESATDAQTIARLLDAGIGDAVILKPQRLGGLDRTLDAIHEASQRGIRATVTNSLETSIGVHAALQVAALLPHPMPACGLATAHWFAQDVCEPPAIHEGHMMIPTTPGLGTAPTRSEVA